MLLQSHIKPVFSKALIHAWRSIRLPLSASAASGDVGCVTPVASVEQTAAGKEAMLAVATLAALEATQAVEAIEASDAASQSGGPSPFKPMPRTWSLLRAFVGVGCVKSKKISFFLVLGTWLRFVWVPSPAGDAQPAWWGWKAPASVLKGQERVRATRGFEYSRSPAI